MPGRIVTYVHRPKRPPRKRKAAAITAPAIVRKRVVEEASRPATHPAPASTNRKPAIVTTTGRKRGKLLRFEQAAEPDDDPEATARVKAFFARMIRPGGPAR